MEARNVWLYGAGLGTSDTSLLLKSPFTQSCHLIQLRRIPEVKREVLGLTGNGNLITSCVPFGCVGCPVWLAGGVVL